MKGNSSQNLSKFKKLYYYLAHVIEQPNFRIPNPQYFVYLLDQTVGQDTRQVGNKSKQKFRCEYWGFGIWKFGCSMT